MLDNTVKIACVIPPITEGSGGIRTVLNNVNKLGDYYKSTPDLYVLPYLGAEPKYISERIQKNYGYNFNKVFVDSKIGDGYDIVIASSWDTVEMVNSCNCKNKFYFIQDYEPWFYPMGTVRIKAENTYFKDLKHIVFGRWLSNYIEKITNKPVESIDFCADHNIYKPLKGARKERAVCAIWQPEKPRRMQELLIETLQILEVAEPSLKVYLYGSNADPPVRLNNVEKLGILSVQDCNALYNKCICGISLSGSNPSRIPFEMMSAGLPVVELYRENNLYDFPSEAIHLSECSPESLAETVVYLVNAPSACEEACHAGTDYMKNRLLENEAETFVRIVDEHVRGKELAHKPFTQIYCKSPIIAGKKLKSIGQQIRIKQVKIIQEQNRVISGDRILFRYGGKEANSFNKYKLAVWTEPDQRDLEWLDLRKQADGSWGCTWVIPESLTDARKYYLHLYQKKTKMDFVDCWEEYIRKSPDNGLINVILEGKEENHSNRIYSKAELLKARIRNKRITKSNLREIVLLDTKMDSMNLGDTIIMDACDDVCREVFPKADLLHVSTHVYRDEIETLRGRIKILCGTNILYQDMKGQEQWHLPNAIESFDKVCLLGIGMNDIQLEKTPTDYTIRLLNAMLATDILHSVRDSLTEKCLNDMGIKNVINTACPTMWGLTPEKLEKVPTRKGKAVLTTVTDYNVDLDADQYMLETLKREYEEVYIWPQGSKDIQLCLSKLINLDDYSVLEPSVKVLNELLRKKDLDYIGTRLHAGIRALNMGRRTLVITEDNRARQIGSDTGFPVMERSDIYDHLNNYIHGEAKYDLRIPWENIELWKNQWDKWKE